MDRTPLSGFFARLRLALVAGFALFGALLVAGSAWYVLNARTEMIEAATRQASTLARALDEHVRRALNAVDVLLAEIAAEMVAAGGVAQVSEAQLHRDLHAKRAMLPQTRALFVYGPDSILRGDTVTVPATRLDGNKMEHVRAHQGGATANLHVGLPILSQVSGLWAFPVTRRIPGNGGGFGGVAGAILEQKHFDAFYGELGLSHGQVIALFRADGALTFRFPQTAVLKPGADPVWTAQLLETVSRREAMGVLRSTDAAGTGERIIAFRRIPDLGLVVALSHEVNEILAPWRRNAIVVAGGIAGTLAVLSFLLWVGLRQIARQAAAERRLREAEEQFRDLAELAPVGIARHECGIIEYANPEFARMFGAPALVGLLGRSVTELAHPDERERLRERLALLGTSPGRVAPALFRVSHADGVESVIEGQAVSSKQGDRMVVHLVTRDVTAEQIAAAEVRRLNETLEAEVRRRTAELQAANDELKSFNYSASHDLRGPLGAILGFSHLLMANEASRLSADGLRLLSLLQSDVQRVVELLEGLLQFSQLGRAPVRKVPVQVPSLVEDVVRELRAEQPAPETEVRVAALPDCRGDPVLLRQVWKNLIGNALKYSGARDRAVVEIGFDGPSREYFVRDNGVGFDMGHAGRLFGVFERLHRVDEFKGTGVGLAICRRIVERHGGRIRADALPGHGATFYFTLGASTD